MDKKGKKSFILDEKSHNDENFENYNMDEKLKTNDEKFKSHSSIVYLL
jgi:hypothetical protein